MTTLECHKIGHRNYFNNKYFFSFTANIIRYCNYKCSYCWEEYNSKDKTDYVPHDVLNRTQQKIVEHCNRNNFKSLYLFYSGGEPLWHPEIFDILKSTKDYDINIAMAITTNLSRDMKFFKQFVDIIKEYDIDMTISATLHHEFINTEHKFNNFLEKVQFLDENNIEIRINFVMNKDIFWEQVEQTEIFKKYNISSVLKHLRVRADLVEELGTDKMEVYDEDMINYLKPEATTTKDKSKIIWYDNFGDKHYFSHQIHTVVHDIRNYYQFYCNSGYTSLAMEFDGDLFRGYACAGMHKLGNAYTGFQLLDDCEPCGFNGNCLPIDIVSIKSKEYFDNKKLNYERI